MFPPHPALTLTCQVGWSAGVSLGLGVDIRRRLAWAVSKAGAGRVGGAWR